MFLWLAVRTELPAIFWQGVPVASCKDAAIGKWGLDASFSWEIGGSRVYFLGCVWACMHLRVTWVSRCIWAPFLIILGTKWAPFWSFWGLKSEDFLVLGPPGGRLGAMLEPMAGQRGASSQKGTKRLTLGRPFWEQFSVLFLIFGRFFGDLISSRFLDGFWARLFYPAGSCRRP